MTNYEVLSSIGCYLAADRIIFILYKAYAEVVLDVVTIGGRVVVADERLAFESCCAW